MEGERVRILGRSSHTQVEGTKLRGGGGVDRCHCADANHEGDQKRTGRRHGVDLRG